MAFPINPADGQVALVNNINYQWDDTNKVWNRQVIGTVGGSGGAITSSLVPTANVTYDLGSPTQRFRSLYLSGNTIDLGGTSIKVDSGGNVAFIPESGTGFVITNTGTTNTLTAPVWSSGTIIPATGNVFFSNILVANSNTALAYTITSGNTLQANLALTTTGNLSGNVTAGSYSFSVDATDTFGQRTSKSFTVVAVDTYTIQYLVVAGGGAGGFEDVGGGGGAGGYLAGSTDITPTVSYSITVGSGGATTPGVGGSGSNSSAFSITAAGGGGGASGNHGSPYNGATGGSGGGASWSGTYGPGTPGQGNRGGTANGTGGQAAGGGGGGAGAAGEDKAGNPNAVGGAGGVGLDWQSLGTYYAGGGGGGGDASPGPAGTGGGGLGGYRSGNPPTTTMNGTANRGGGGGGSGGYSGGPGGTGGSGIVIVRYVGSQRGSGGTYSSGNGYSYHTFTSSTTYTA